LYCIWIPREIVLILHSCVGISPNICWAIEALGEIEGADEHWKEVVLVAVLTDDDVKPKSGVGAGTSFDADEPEVVPEKDLDIDAPDEVFCLFCWVVEAESAVSIFLRAEP
jgi:hypothetical protein